MLARALLAAEGLIRRPKRSPEQTAHVLVLEYRLPLGCLVHMTPVFESIKRSATSANRTIEITVATRGLGVQILRHSPFIDQLLETPDPTTHLLGAIASLRSQLRSHALRPDCVLTGASDQRTRIALLGLFASAGWRGGFTLQPAMYHRPLAYDAAGSLIANNLRVAQLIGCTVTATEPRVFFSPGDAQTAAALLRGANPDARPVAVFVTQNSGGQSLGWHSDRWVEVIRHAALTRGFAIVYVGTAPEAPAIEAIREAAGGIGTSIAGRTSATQLAAVLAASDLAVTLDTGTMHVARAAGLPMVVLGPSWQPPLEWLPLGIENVRILRGPDLPARPPNYRFDEITAGAVIAAFDDLAQVYPPLPSARAARIQASLSAVDHLAPG